MPGLDLASDFLRSIIVIEEEKDSWGAINPGTFHAIKSVSSMDK